ncbi:MAG: flavodoxin family protein [Candidatus Omnitrophica bacterium]|nr:flavodoxin family protein [Candidatus Omnitrophota bacterium]
MVKVLIVYYSRSGNTKKMAELIKSGLEKEKVEVVLKQADDTQVRDLLRADAIIMGSPVYYGTMAAPLKKLLDDSVSNHGELDGKIGGAFSSSANIAGGNETTILDILNAMLIHGMITQGDPKGDHYGPVSIGKPDQRVEKECIRFGQRMAQLTKRLKG